MVDDDDNGIEDSTEEEPHGDDLTPSSLPSGVGNELYRDVIKPSAEPLSEIVQITSNTVRACLVPMKGLVWGIDRLEAIIVEGVASRFSNKRERLTTPDPAIAGPAIESMRYTAQHALLREMYIELLATAMDAIRDDAHPAHVEIIKQLSPIEAQVVNVLQDLRGYPILVAEHDDWGPMRSFVSDAMEKVEYGHDAVRNQFFSKISCEIPGQRFPDAVYDNLVRLGLIELRIRNVKYMDTEDRTEYFLVVTDFGQGFLRSVTR